MSVAVRLDNQLVQDAEGEGLLHKRTPPKQIEYWAEIGKNVARHASSGELLALLQGYAQVSISAVPSAAVQPGDVFRTLEQDRQQGALSRSVTQAGSWYEASRDQPGQLDRVQADGARESGYFRDGRFIPAE